MIIIYRADIYFMIQVYVHIYLCMNTSFNGAKIKPKYWQDH